MFGLPKKPRTAGDAGTGTKMVDLKIELTENLRRIQECEQLDAKIADKQLQVADLDRQIASRIDDVMKLEKRAFAADTIIKKTEAERMRILADVPAEISRRQKLVEACKAFCRPLQLSEPYLKKMGWISHGNGRWKCPATGESFDSKLAVLHQAAGDLATD